MLISHRLDDIRIEKEAEEAGFLLTNRKGGFLNLGIASKYRGLFFRLGNDIIKVLDDIRIKGEIKTLRHNFWHVIRCRDSVMESFFMPFGTDALVYQLSHEEDIELLFDVKKGYDNRSFGRNYRIFQENGKVIVEFTKKTDSREDSSHGQEEYTIFIAIDSGSSNVKILDEWQNQHYSFDKTRKSYPVDRFVYKGLCLKSKKIIIAFSENKVDAVSSCDKVIKHLDKFISLQKKYAGVSIKDIKDRKLNLAVKCATEALDSLLVNHENSVDFYAGLPWFFQFWSRDSLIALKALILDKEYSVVKRILMKYIHQIRDDGLLPNRIPITQTKSADAIGWYFKRWADFIEILRQEKQFRNYFKKSEIMYIINKLEDSINKVFRNYTLDSLAVNQNQETWMDTLSEGESRKGARIEIQALRIAMYDFLYKLTDNKIYKEMADKLIVKVKELFWNGSYFKDGVNDPTIRPNLFIAAYIYPGLLSSEEWITCFENVLPKLWLDWGGLSTIDKTDSSFHSETTGENSASYHRGDSWYWLNNLVALVLHRTDYNRFKHYVDKIIEASCEDILFKGFIGCHSEISSASRQEAQGCLNQAWSNAFFIELIEEIK